jgi:hypothetical protein
MTISAEVTLLEKSNGGQIPTVKERFAARKKEEMGGPEKAPTPKAIERVARYALEMGLVDECAKVLDELAENDKNHPVIKAYLTVKADLDKPVDRLEAAAKWQAKLLDGYKISQNDKQHVALIHHAKIDPNEVKPHLEQLERTVRAYYYWWAMRGIVLPVAKERQVAVLTESPSHFSVLQTNLTPSPVMADSFHARREATTVLSSKRTDLAYSKMDTEARKKWAEGYNMEDLLNWKGKDTKGVPKVDRQGRPIQALRPVLARQPRIYALILKLMEAEYQQTALTHEASRQLLFASKLLPRNVNAPEWVQFGMGSFFETPLQSPWPSIGAANPYWLPRFKESYAKKKYEATPAATLKRVVTDGYFREKPKSNKHEDVESHLRRARSASWALTYYLARTETYLPKLQRYFKELSKQPRDTELDEKTLWACFTKAFDLDTDDKVATLANNWLRYIQTETLEASAIHEKIRKTYADMNAPPPAPKQGNGPGIGGGLGGVGGNLGPPKGN